MDYALADSLLPGIPRIDSPLFAELHAQGVFGAHADVAHQLHTDGFAIVDIGSDRMRAFAQEIRLALEPTFDLERWAAEHSQGGLRLQDAWRDVAAVRELALDPLILDLLEKLYGRVPFAFQSLNFPVGTQQHYHSDAVHFHSDPPGFMCGVWVALEDIHPDAGPLEYYPGSQRLPYLQVRDVTRVQTKAPTSGQEVFHPVWNAMIEAHGLQRLVFTPRVGQALIWVANLLHGGSPVIDHSRTRWSQVTHYFFADCHYYTPMHSQWPRGPIAWRDPLDIATGRCRSGAPDPQRPGAHSAVTFSSLPDCLRTFD